MIVITGATGHTGHVIADKLLARGESIRVIGRDEGRLAQFVQKGAEAFVADLTDTISLPQAFRGAKSVYLMIPPNPAASDVNAFQEQVSDALASATREAGVEYAVLLSSVGADKPEGTGPVVGLHKFEQKLNAIEDLQALYVRAGYFMENLLPQISVIKNFGLLAGPLRAELRVPMIASRDIGAFAADALLALNFSGKQTRELLGQRDVTYREVAGVIGRAIGRPDLAYTQLPASQLKPAFTQMGMSDSMADLILQMSEAMNAGYMAAIEPRSAQNTTSTSIEQFTAEEFLPRFTEKAAGA